MTTILFSGIGSKPDPFMYNKVFPPLELNRYSLFFTGSVEILSILIISSAEIADEKFKSINRVQKIKK